MRSTCRFIILLIGLTLIFTSCNKEDELTENDATTFGIRHDRSLSEYELIATNKSPYNKNNYPDFSAVVNFVYTLDGNKGEEYTASGVLISPNWILTAGHNFYIADSQKEPANVNTIVVNTGVNPNSPQATHTVESLTFFPTWLNQSEVISNANDLCLVKLTNTINNIQPATFYKENLEPVGDTVWYCGYGDYSTQPGQNKVEYSKKHAVQNILDRKSNGIVSRTKTNVLYYGGHVAFDFDSPSGNINSLGDNFISEDEILLGEGTSDNKALDFEGTTVEGDNGGPLFAKIDEEWVVIGILSGGATEPISNHADSDYGDISIFTRVSTCATWIASIIQ